MPQSPRSRAEAMHLLEELGAPPRLVRHIELVGEAADDLLGALERLRVPLDADFVRMGVVLHDVGKTLHRAELDGPGSQHEPAGERLLLDRGVDPALAAVCRSHAAWRDLATRLEDLLIALSDKLWKGVRVRELEERVIDQVASILATDQTSRPKGERPDRWALFTELDTVFERIAAGGHERLERSRV